MIRRLLLVVLAAVSALLLGTSPTSAMTEGRGSLPAYTYDSLDLVAASTHTAIERGPPASNDNYDHDEAGDRRLNGASACSDTGTSRAYTYNASPLLAPNAVRANATATVVGRSKGACASLVSAGVAANTVDDGAFRLIGANRAEIDPRKFTEYVLNPNHAVGGNKARVFESAFGFNQSNADDLIAQLRRGATTFSRVCWKHSVLSGRSLGPCAVQLLRMMTWHGQVAV